VSLFDGELKDSQFFVEVGQQRLLVLIGDVPPPVCVQLLHLRFYARAQYLIDGFEFLLFFIDDFFRLHLGLVVVGRSRRLFDHAQQLQRFQVNDFGDLALLDQEVGIFDVELHAPEQIPYLRQVGRDAVYEKFCYFVFGYLARNYELLAVFVAGGTHLFLHASEFYGDGGLLDACKAFLVDELSQSCLQTQHLFAGGSEEKLDGVEDVALAGTVETSDGVELGIEA
jgi:hypothetical protein